MMALPLRSEEHTSELQSQFHLVCRLLLEKKNEFVSVTEKLMDELAQCYNVLPQLDINNTIDHRPEGDEKWFLENEKTVTQFCRKLAAERPLKDIRDEYNYRKKKGIKDECSRLLDSFFFNSPATTEIYTLSLHDALPISPATSPTTAAASSSNAPTSSSSPSPPTPARYSRSDVVPRRPRAKEGDVFAIDVDDLAPGQRSEEHTSELQSQFHLVCRLLLEKK